MGRRSFICRSSLGVHHLCMSILLFWVFGFLLCYCVDVLIYGGTVSLLEFVFFFKWFMCDGMQAIWNLHFLIILISIWHFLSWNLSSCWYFVTYFCLKICEEDALLVKYLWCTMCIFLRNTGKHDVCSGQTSDIVWCCIFRSYCSFKQHGEWNSTALLIFLFYILHLTDNATKMQMILFIAYSWTFLSL